MFNLPVRFGLFKRLSLHFVSEMWYDFAIFSLTKASHVSEKKASFPPVKITMDIDDMHQHSQK